MGNQLAYHTSITALATKDQSQRGRTVGKLAEMDVG